MINRDDIEAGDKVYTRDGGCLVAYEDGGVWLGGLITSSWREDGAFFARDHNRLDIIRIDKAPKHVVEECIMGFILRDGQHASVRHTFINGKLEKSEQVK